jgi:hypothetical protein
MEYHYDTYKVGGCKNFVVNGMSIFKRMWRRLGNIFLVKEQFAGHSYLRLKLARRRQTRSCIFSASLTGTLKLLAMIEKATGSLSPVKA